MREVYYAGTVLEVNTTVVQDVEGVCPLLTPPDEVVPFLLPI